MNVKKTVKKILALGAGATMVGATIMGAMAYDLADYPEPYIVDGVFDGTIVVGAAAATQDVLGAIDIGASLQADAVTQEAVDIPGEAGTVNLEGDTYKIETSSDAFELRENVGSVIDTFDSSDLDALQGGTITTDEGSTDYNQYLRLEVLNSTSDNQLVDWGVNYRENEDDELADWMVIEHDQSKGFFEWELEFEEGLESSIDANADLEDIENEVFNIFGTDYTFVDSTVGTTTARSLTLEFMAGDVSSTLREGETKTFTIDGVEYSVTLIFVSDPSGGTAVAEAKFMVNGEVTKSLEDGDTDTLSGGLQIGVRDILVNSRDGIVEFFLGADKIAFTDTITNSSDNGFTNEVEIGNVDINEGQVLIRTNMVSGDGDQIAEEDEVLEITTIKYRLEADAVTKRDLYVPKGAGIKDYLEEPEGLLSPTFDIRYEGLTEPETYPVSLLSGQDNQYELTFTNIRGDTFDVPFLSIQETGTPGLVQFGEDDSSNNEDFVFVESGASAYNIGLDDYFVVSDSPNNKKSVTSILQFTDIDTDNNKLKFDVLSGSDRELTYDDGNKEGNLNVGSHTFKVKVDETNEQLTVDMDGDGAYTENTTVNMTVWGGGVLKVDRIWWLNGSGTDINISVGVDSIGDGQNVADVDTLGQGNTDETVQVEMSLSFEASIYDEATSGETVQWTASALESSTDYIVDLDIDASDVTVLYEDQPAAAAYNSFTLEEDEDDNNHNKGMITFGALVDHYQPSGSNDADELTITVPEQQVLAQVFLTAGSVERTESAGGFTQDVVNPIAVGLAVLDSDAPALGTANLIVVGGPCANSVAAEIMGTPGTWPDCSAPFVPGKALIKSHDSGDNVAILVAGYEADETLGASYVLSSYEDYAALQGEEVEVVVPDLSNMVVQAVTADMGDDDMGDGDGDDAGDGDDGMA